MILQELKTSEIIDLTFMFQRLPGRGACTEISERRILAGNLENSSIHYGTVSLPILKRKNKNGSVEDPNKTGEREQNEKTYSKADGSDD
ncbi:MAG: hypothetical protein LUC90_10205 [Lachnospiraceae bacterium]|nr:hypothetical protein [Lachnospiraceae bacterium]